MISRYSGNHTLHGLPIHQRLITDDYEKFEFELEKVASVFFVLFGWKFFFEGEFIVGLDYRQNSLLKSLGKQGTFEQESEKAITDLCALTNKNRMLKTTEDAWTFEKMDMR